MHGRSMQDTCGVSECPAGTTKAFAGCSAATGLGLGGTHDRPRSCRAGAVLDVVDPLLLAAGCRKRGQQHGQHGQLAARPQAHQWHVTPCAESYTRPPCSQRNDTHVRQAPNKSATGVSDREQLLPCCQRPYLDAHALARVHWAARLAS